MDKSLQKISAVEFVNRLKEDCRVPDKNYVLFLGAGCSVSSGIPDASSLVKEWLERLYELNHEGNIKYENWLTKIFPNYSTENAASFYGPLMKRRFHSEGDRQAEIERICSNKYPGFGYAVLSDLILNRNEKFNIVLTTNFDDLIADSLYIYQGVRPLVIGHESLASFIRPTRTRPLIVKLHGDYHLSPLNIPEEIKNIKEEYIYQTSTLLYDRGVIFIGYGGNDVGIKDMFERLPSNALPFPIYWVSQHEPNCLLKEFLLKKNAIWVEKFDFDELMLLLKNCFGINHPERRIWENVFQNYIDVYEKLRKKVLSLSKNDEEERALKEAVSDADKELPDWYTYYFRARDEEEKNPELADQMYQEGLQKFPKLNDLLQAYAIFLDDIKKDYVKAEEYYQRALETDPENATNLGNYAYFLHYKTKNYKKAEEYYQRALEADPENATNLGKYAYFLHYKTKNYKKAEEYYQRALEANPRRANTLGNYAIFLNYVKKNYDKAEEYYQRALEADPKSAITLGNYAVFLGNIRKDFDKAEEYHQRAIEADPKYANALGNYAGLLFVLNKNEKAEELLKRSFLCDMENNGALEVELWFYAYLHSKNYKQSDSMKKLKELLKDGKRSPGWDLSLNIQTAIKNGHTNKEWLQKIADVINDVRDIKELDQWVKWKNL